MSVCADTVASIDLSTSQHIQYQEADLYHVAPHHSPQAYQSLPATVYQVVAPKDNAKSKLAKLDPSNLVPSSNEVLHTSIELKIDRLVRSRDTSLAKLATNVFEVLTLGAVG